MRLSESNSIFLSFLICKEPKTKVDDWQSLAEKVLLIENAPQDTRVTFPYSYAILRAVLRLKQQRAEASTIVTRVNLLPAQTYASEYDHLWNGIDSSPIVPLGLQAYPWGPIVPSSLMSPLFQSQNELLTVPTEVLQSYPIHSKYQKSHKNF